jgi:hypothetical protein
MLSLPLFTIAFRSVTGVIGNACRKEISGAIDQAICDRLQPL